MTLGLGIVGLGVQGRRMVSRLPEHGGFRVVAGWDPDPASAQLAASQGVPLVQGADEVLSRTGIDCLFVASPPASHMKLAAPAALHGEVLATGRRECMGEASMPREERLLRYADTQIRSQDDKRCG